MAGMDQGNEKQMSMNVATKVILCFSDLASAEKSVKSGHNFFPSVKWARILVNLFSMVSSFGKLYACFIALQEIPFANNFFA